MKTFQARVEPDVLKKARKYCVVNGVKLTWLASRAIEDYINRLNTKREDVPDYNAEYPPLGHQTEGFPSKEKVQKKK